MTPGRRSAVIAAAPLRRGGGPLVLLQIGSGDVRRGLDQPECHEKVREFTIGQRYLFVDPLRGFVFFDRYHKYLGYSDWLTSYAFLEPAGNRIGRQRTGRDGV